MPAVVLIILFILLLVAVYMVFVKLYINSVKKKKLLYDIDDDKNIRIVKNVEYKKVNGKSLLMDVYLPEDNGPNDKLPAVILIHGGESIIKDAKDWKMYTSYGRLLAENGLACVVFNQRPAGMTASFKNISESSRDILDLVDYARKNAGVWRIDENRLCIWGFSAGAAYLSLFFRNLPGYVKCIVSFYGLLDIKEWTKKNESLLKPFYPESYLSLKPVCGVPVLIARAGKDYKRINAGSDNFIKTALLKNVSLKCLVHPNGKHAFDIRNDDDETRKIIKQTIEFIKCSI